LEFDASAGAIAHNAGGRDVNLIVRTILLTVCLAPYLYFGIRDVLHHQQHRPVSFTERLLHLTLGTTLTIVIPHAYLGHFEVVTAGIVLFVLARALDEFVFHRQLAGAETDLHAKTHFGFLIFVVGLMVTNWMERQNLFQ
jgi:hypothetical protein